MSCGGTQNFPFWDTRVDLGRLPGGSSYSSVNTKCVCAGLGERVFQSGDRALQRPGGDLFIYFGSGSLRKSVNPSVDHQDKETETSETPQNKENDLLQKEFGKVTQQMTATHSKQQQQNLGKRRI